MLVDMKEQSETAAEFLEDLADQIRSGEVAQFALFLDRASEGHEPYTFSTTGNMLEMLGLIESCSTTIKVGYVVE